MNIVQVLKSSRIFILFCLSVALTFSACGKNGNQNNTQEDEGMVFRFLNEQDPATLDVNKATGVYENRILNIMFEGLTRYGNEGVAAELGNAERHETSEDGKVHTFFLRKDAKWSDGSAVTAHDYVASYRRILNPTTGAQYAQMLYCIAGAAEVNQSKPDKMKLELEKLGVKALDDYTLEFTLKYPVPYFFELTTHYTFFPIPRKVVEKHGDSWTSKKNIISNGAFVLKERVLGDKLVFEKNPHYWQKDAIKLDKVIAYTTKDHETQYRMFQSNAVDWLCSPVSKSVYPKVKDNSEWLAAPYLGTFFFSFNTKKAPFNDPRVRRALSLAIDREVIAKTITDAGELPAYSYVPKGTAMGSGKYTPTYEFSKNYKENIKEAKKLLAEAGFPGGKGFPVFNILYNINDQNKRICLVASNMWDRHLGIKGKLENNEWKTYLDKLKNVNYDIARRGWIGDYNDAYTFMELWMSSNGNNHTHWGNADYDDKINKSNYESDLKNRLVLFQSAEEILLEESPIIPIYFYVADQMVKPYVRGFYPRIQNGDHGKADIAGGKFNVTDNHPFNYIWIDQEAKKKYMQGN